MPIEPASAAVTAAIERAVAHGSTGNAMALERSA